MLVEVYKFEKLCFEVNVILEVCQEGYEVFVIIDDYLMYFIGIIKDQNGIKYYIIKNFWGIECNIFGGYLNMFESYVCVKIIFFMVYKDVILVVIKQKLGIK